MYMSVFGSQLTVSIHSPKLTEGKMFRLCRKVYEIKSTAFVLYYFSDHFSHTEVYTQVVVEYATRATVHFYNLQCTHSG